MLIRSIVSVLAFSAMHAAALAAPRVTVQRAPHEGLQPRVAVGSDGRLHLLYFAGEAHHGDLFYIRSDDGGASYSTPIRVNSQPGSAVAAGTMRGGQIALGRNGRVHVAWNGSGQAKPKGPLNPKQPADSPHNGLPMLYSRVNDAGTAFEPQRNLMKHTFALDGGGTVAADDAGNVFVTWHAGSGSGDGGEAGRRVWMARSTDDGLTFAKEEPVSPKAGGACGCCGMTSLANPDGGLYLLYRIAAGSVNRHTRLLFSKNGTGPFEPVRIHRWIVSRCPASSYSLAPAKGGVLMAWETNDQVFYARFDSATAKRSRPVHPPTSDAKRKHPTLAVNHRGQVLLAWTEVGGWGQGGKLAWQVYDADGQPIPDANGTKDDLRPWSLVAAIARPDGGFTLMY